MINYILYSLSCVNHRSFVRTGQSPPEEEQSFHSVRAHATCGGTKHPSSPWEVGGKCTPSDGSTTQALLRFMRPVHLPPDCVASLCLPSLAMLAAWSLAPSVLLPPPPSPLPPLPSPLLRFTQDRLYRIQFIMRQQWNHSSFFDH